MLINLGTQSRSTSATAKKSKLKYYFIFCATNISPTKHVELIGYLYDGAHIIRSSRKYEAVVYAESSTKNPIQWKPPIAGMRSNFPLKCHCWQANLKR